MHIQILYAIIILALCFLGQKAHLLSPPMNFNLICYVQLMPSYVVLRVYIFEHPYRRVYSGDYIVPMYLVCKSRCGNPISCKEQLYLIRTINV